MANLEIMIFRHQRDEPVKRSLALLLCELVDACHMVAEREDRLPTRDGVGADDRVDGFEYVADILGGAAWLAVELKAVFFGAGGEAGLGVGGCEGLEEALVGCRETIIEFVA
jgi:hypothetical protein